MLRAKLYRMSCYIIFWLVEESRKGLGMLLIHTAKSLPSETLQIRLGALGPPTLRTLSHLARRLTTFCWRDCRKRLETTWKGRGTAEADLAAVPARMPGMWVNLSWILQSRPTPRWVSPTDTRQCQGQACGPTEPWLMKSINRHPKQLNFRMICWGQYITRAPLIKL